MIQSLENMIIGDLFYGRIPFVIEKYQRDYAWDKEYIEDFIGDIKELYKTYDDLRDPKETRHFFGGIVSVQRGVPDTASGRIFEIVDGQQRLATFMMTLCNISKGFKEIAKIAENICNDTLKENADSEWQKIDEDFIFYKEQIRGRRIPTLRLKLSKSDSLYFEELIKGDTPQKQRESHHRISTAFTTIYDELVGFIIDDEALTLEDKFAQLQKMEACITDSCHVIHIVSNSKADAYRLFTVLNDRGVSLSDGDLLRAHTLEILEGDDERQGEAEDWWNIILAEDKRVIDDYLRHFFTSHLGMRPKRRDLFGQFRSKLLRNEQIQGSEFVIENTYKFIKNLLDEFKIYSNLKDGQWPYATSSLSEWDRSRLKRLMLTLKHELCIPLLMSIVSSGMPEKRFSDVVNTIERFFFRYKTIVGTHAGRLGKEYYEYASLIRRNPSDFEFTNFRNDLEILLQNHAPDDLFETRLSSEMVYSNSSNKRNLIKHFLTTIEDYYKWYERGSSGSPSPEKHMIYDLDQISIDHIYPQRSGSANTNDDLGSVKHNIGNLTILTPNDNSELGNLPFEQKKSQNYCNSNVRLNRKLCDYQEWNMTTFNERNDELLEMAKKIFTV